MQIWDVAFVFLTQPMIKILYNSMSLFNNEPCMQNRLVPPELWVPLS